MQILSVFVMCFTCICCSQDDMFQDMPENKSLGESTRKVFSTNDEFEEFCAKLRTDNVVPIVDEEELSIVELFKKLTQLEALYNESNEYQIGDTIYKLGDSGYTQYQIATASYLSAISLIKDEDRLIKNLASYKKVSESDYEIAPGVLLTYTGKPIIEIQDVATDPKTRINIQYDTKVTVSFWVAHKAGASVSCGFKMKVERESTGKAYSTLVDLSWKGVVLETWLQGNPPRTMETIYVRNSGIVNENASSLSFMVFEKESLNADSWGINLVAGTITAKAKAPNGRDVIAQIER